MRWSIIRLIWLRELRDQVRDRRTLFMIVVLPLLIYPILGYAIFQFALGFSERPSVIGIVRGAVGAEGADGADHFPARKPATAGLSAAPPLTWLTLMTAAPDASGLDRCAGAAALAHAGHQVLDYPYLVHRGRFTPFESPPPSPLATLLAQARLKIVFLEDDSSDPLDEKTVDVILRAPPDFFARLEAEERQRTDTEPVLGLRPAVDVRSRPGDDRSRQASQRLAPVFDLWDRALRKVRLARTGLPPTFDRPFDLFDPEAARMPSAAENLLSLLVRIFPFMLVMWSLAGALYPAVDLCAGEKERGTMETLLISPAAREEIVVGKFLTIWVFSAGTSLLNLLSMGLTTWNFGDLLPQGAVTFGALFWCVVLILPLSAFFSAISLALGAYARSSKEGQYYLMPLFVVTMPLVFLTLAPGVELSPFYSLVPVTGVALLMQRLMTVSLGQVPWLYFIPVLAPIALYSWLALRWAIDQFHREEVLFREAERLDLGLWLRRLLREKEPLPTSGQALFCFGLILLLRWCTFGLGRDWLLHTSISLVAFVAAPVMLMALMLNTRPAQSLSLRRPQLSEVGLAAVLALLLLPPLLALAQTIFRNYPTLTQLLEDRQPLVQELLRWGETDDAAQPARWPFFVVFALLPAVCEELAFRGFILTGLLRRFRPRTSIILSSFLFALFHMNVFQFLPSFFLGIVLGLVTVRSKSVFPAIVFHLLYNSLLIEVATNRELPNLTDTGWAMVIAICLASGLALLWWLYRRPYVALARRLEQESRHLDAAGFPAARPTSVEVAGEMSPSSDHQPRHGERGP